MMVRGTRWTPCMAAALRGCSPPQLKSWILNPELVPLLCLHKRLRCMAAV